VEAADAAQAAGAGAVVLGTVSEVGEQFEGAAEALEPLRATVEATVGDVLPILVIALGGFLVWQMVRVKRARVEDHRNGRNLGR